MMIVYAAASHKQPGGQISASYRAEPNLLSSEDNVKWRSPRLPSPCVTGTERCSTPLATTDLDGFKYTEQKTEM